MFDAYICKKHFVSNNEVDNMWNKTFVGQMDFICKF